jgi:hypothetical protein
VVCVTRHRAAFTAALVLLAVVAAPAVTAAAPTPSSSLLIGASYTRAIDDDVDIENQVLAGLRSRHMFGRSLAWCTGFDGAIGGADSGVAYEAEIYPAGVALALGDEQYASICSGAGLSGISGSLPFAFQFPVELATELQLGPVRVIAWARVRWIAGEEGRQDGADLIDFADEIDALVGLRFGRNARFWDRVTAGHGAFVGVHYRELGGAQFAGVTLGLSLWGGRR